MKPAAFDYHRPASAAEAVELLASLGDDAKVLSGGQSLIPMLNLRLTAFEHLVDIGRIAELRGIERRGDRLWIGAGTTEATVEHDADVAAAVPLLARASRLIGHSQIRNRGTIGGCLAHADPAAEYPAVALALDAELEVLGPAGARTVAAVDFFTGLWDTDLGPDELLTGVSFPIWTGPCGYAVEELARRHGDFAIAGALVAVQLDNGAEGRVERCAIGLIGMGPTPLRARTAEASATRAGVAEIDAAELGRAAMADLDAVPSDLHGSAAYRLKVGATLVERAWNSAMEEALGG